MELREAKLYEHALPELEDLLNDRCARRTDFQPEGEFKMLVCFGTRPRPALPRRSRPPAVRLVPLPGSGGERRAPCAAWYTIERIRTRTLTRLVNGEAVFLREALHRHTSREWRDPKARSVPKYDLAVLYDPNEKLPPSSQATIKHFARIAEKLSFDVEPITRRQLAELAEYDGLFIRETTSIDNHTYRFARRAWQEGMPVIDDPISMIRCMNKVFLMELLGSNQEPTPPTMMLADAVRPRRGAMDQLGFCRRWSRSRTARSPAASTRSRRSTSSSASPTNCSRRPTSVLAQKFLPTEFDWRFGVLSGQPLVRVPVPHGARPDIGRSSSTIPTARRAKAATAPSISTRRRRDDVDLAVRAAQSDRRRDSTASTSSRRPTGSWVMEVNDNPNIEHGIEDAVGKDEVWTLRPAVVHRPAGTVSVAIIRRGAGRDCRRLSSPPSECG